MTQTCESLFKRLEQDGEKTVAFFNSLSADQWHLPVYNMETEWKVRDVLAHFVSAEASFFELIKDIQAGGSGASEYFDIEAFNQQEVKSLRTATPEHLLVQFQRLRKKTVDLGLGMLPSDLLRVGRHPFLGEASLSDIIKLVYRHNQIHLRDLKRIVIK